MKKNATANKQKKSEPKDGPRIRGESLVVSVKKLRANKWNYNEMDEFTLQKLKNTIVYDGFVADVIVRETPNEATEYEIIDGEHRWFAVKELGMKRVPIKNLGKLGDTEAKALSVKLNELKGRANTDSLALIIDEVFKTGDEVLIGTLPYEESELNDLLRLVAKDLEDVHVPDEDDEEAEKKPASKRKRHEKFDIHTILKLGYMTDEDEEEFVELLRKVEEKLGVVKRPYRLLMQLMRDCVDEKKKKKRRKNAS